MNYTGEQLTSLPDGYYYMQDQRQFVGNCILWWAECGRGYTTKINEAHVFTASEALERYKMRPDVDRPWPKDYIDERIQQTVDVQLCDFGVAIGDANGNHITTEVEVPE